MGSAGAAGRRHNALPRTTLHSLRSLRVALALEIECSRNVAGHRHLPHHGNVTTTEDNSRKFEKGEQWR